MSESKVDLESWRAEPGVTFEQPLRICDVVPILIATSCEKFQSEMCLIKLQITNYSFGTILRTVKVLLISLMSFRREIEHEFRISIPKATNGQRFPCPALLSL